MEFSQPAREVILVVCLVAALVIVALHASEAIKTRRDRQAVRERLGAQPDMALREKVHWFLLGASSILCRPSELPRRETPEQAYDRMERAAEDGSP
jgi:hypothetical protein